MSARSEGEIAEEKAAAAWLLDRFIPLAEWLTMCPRTDGDLWMYFSISRNLWHRLEHGENPPPAPPDPDTDRGMDCHTACLNDEESFFRFDADPAAEPHA